MSKGKRRYLLALVGRMAEEERQWKDLAEALAAYRAAMSRQTR